MISRQTRLRRGEKRATQWSQSLVNSGFIVQESFSGVMVSSFVAEWRRASDFAKFNSQNRRETSQP